MTGGHTRRHVLRRLLGAPVAAAGTVLGPPMVAVAEEPALLRIATGGVTAIYSALGSAICRVLEDDPVARRQTCTTVATQGSLGSLRFLRSGIVELAIAQGELIRNAYQGAPPFDVDRANPELRILFGTVIETLLVVANSRLPIAGTRDLAGRRVDLGARGSGGRVTVERLLEAAGLSSDRYAQVLGNPSARQPLALCTHESDAFAFMGANPNGVIQDAVARCGGRIVGLDPGLLEELAATLPSYEAVTVPAGTYRNQEEDLATLGVTAFVVAERGLPDELAERVTAAVFDHLDQLRRLHLAFEHLDEPALLAPCPDVPYHDGALAYFAKAGVTPPACP